MTLNIYFLFFGSMSMHEMTLNMIYKKVILLKI